MTGHVGWPTPLLRSGDYRRRDGDYCPTASLGRSSAWLHAVYRGQRRCSSLGVSGRSLPPGSPAGHFLQGAELPRGLRNVTQWKRFKYEHAADAATWILTEIAYPSSALLPAIVARQTRPPATADIPAAASISPATWFHTHATGGGDWARRPSRQTRRLPESASVAAETLHCRPLLLVTSTSSWDGPWQGLR